MEYELKSKNGKVRRYEVSYSQVLQKQTNNLLIGLIILILVLLIVVGFVLYRIDSLNIATRLIAAGGGS